MLEINNVKLKSLILYSVGNASNVKLTDDKKIDYDVTDKIGFVTEERSLLTKMTVKEQVLYYGTLKGMKEEDMLKIADLIHKVLCNTQNEKGSKAKYKLDASVKAQVTEEVNNLLKKYPLYPEIEL